MIASPAKRRSRPPLWIWLLAPTLVYPLIIVLHFAHPPTYDAFMRKEGLIEYLSVAVLILGCVYGFHLWRRRGTLPGPARWVSWWYLIVTIGCIVVAGEELSWGQHLGLWSDSDVPEIIAEVNDQNETNFHNMTNALDQGPTNLVVLATLYGCFLNPLLLRLMRKRMPLIDPGYWVWPTSVCLPVAIGVLIIPWPKRLLEWTTGAYPGWLRHSELHEFYIALLFTVYLASAFTRLRHLQETQPAAATEEGTEITGHLRLAS